MTRQERTNYLVTRLLLVKDGLKHNMLEIEYDITTGEGANSRELATYDAASEWVSAAIKVLTT